MATLLSQPLSLRLMFITLLAMEALLIHSATCRTVPTSPLSDDRAEELVHKNVEEAAAAAAHITYEAKLTSNIAEARLQSTTLFAAPPTSTEEAVWKLRKLWVSVTGKDAMSATTISSWGEGGENKQKQQQQLQVEGRGGGSITSSETIAEEARQVPGGPDPLHHSNRPSSP